MLQGLGGAPALTSKHTLTHDVGHCATLKNRLTPGDLLADWQLGPRDLRPSSAETSTRQDRSQGSAVLAPGSRALRTMLRSSGSQLDRTLCGDGSRLMQASGLRLRGRALAPPGQDVTRFGTHHYLTYFIRRAARAAPVPRGPLGAPRSVLEAPQRRRAAASSAPPAAWRERVLCLFVSSFLW